MDYKLDSVSKNITRTADGASIPPDPENVDYQTYLAWVALGNSPAPVDDDTV
jgi:hypothetical protein